MKLGDLVPGTSTDLTPVNKSLENVMKFQDFLSKSHMDRIRTDSVGIEQLYFDWLRTAYAYRRMFIQDLYLLAFDVTEIRTAIQHVKNEVFRKGFEEYKPKFASKCVSCGEIFQREVKYCNKCFKKNGAGQEVVDGEGKKIPSDTIRPDEGQYKRFDEMKTSCNIFNQSLEEVLMIFDTDLSISDDAFLHLNKSYVFEKGNLVPKYSKVEEIRRIHPALVEFDLDKNGLPKNSHWICLEHRDIFRMDEGQCLQCGKNTYPVMYIYNHRGKKIYLLESEVIHCSRFDPSETYGYSAILSIMQKVLTLSGMDRFLYRYFFERKTPTQIILTNTDDPASLEIERARVEAKMMEDPTYTPWIAVSQKTGRGRTDVVKLFHTLHEMDYLNVRNEIRERVSAIYGVSPIWMGHMEGIGGISGQTQQLVVMSRVVERNQRLYNEKVFPVLMAEFGITDWEIKLRAPEEKTEQARMQFASQKVQIASQLVNMGFDVKLQTGKGTNIEELDFEVSGKANKPDMMGGAMSPIGAGQLPAGAPQEEEEDVSRLSRLLAEQNAGVEKQKTDLVLPKDIHVHDHYPPHHRLLGHEKKEGESKKWESEVYGNTSD